MSREIWGLEDVSESLRGASRDLRGIQRASGTLKVVSESFRDVQQGLRGPQGRYREFQGLPRDLRGVSGRFWGGVSGDIMRTKRRFKSLSVVSVSFIEISGSLQELPGSLWDTSKGLMVPEKLSKVSWAFIHRQ